MGVVEVIVFAQCTHQVPLIPQHQEQHRLHLPLRRHHRHQHRPVPANTADEDTLSDPVLSEDGNSVTLYAGYLKVSTAQGIAMKTISSGTSTTVTASDIKISQTGSIPLAISNGGSAILYDSFATITYGQLFIYNGGTTAVPARADTYPESISLTDDGTSLLYTLWYDSTDSTQTKQPDINFPGIFDWQLG